jgi:hypothetical protein
VAPAAPSTRDRRDSRAEDEEKRDDEIAYLRKFIYLRDVDLFAQTLAALDRFSVRI